METNLMQNQMGKKMQNELKCGIAFLAKVDLFDNVQNKVTPIKTPIIQ